MSEQPISPDPLAPPEIGSRLAQAREAAALTVDQVAAKLLLSASQIRALESGRMPSSYSADYYERTVRKYADFLGMEVDQTALPAAAAAVGQAHAIGQDTSPAGRLAGFTPHRVGIGGRVDMPTIDSGWNAKPWVLGAAVLVLAILGLVYQDKLPDLSAPARSSGDVANSAKPASPSSSADTGSLTATPAAPGGQVNRPADLASPGGSGASSAENERKSATAPATDTSQADATLASASQTGASQTGSPAPDSARPGDPATPPTAAKPATAAAPEGRVKVTCSTPCWVQATASDGKRSEKIYQPDEELVMPAEAIASLIIGNAKSARMTIDGVDVNLNQFMKGSSDVARIPDTALQELLR